MLNLYLDPFLFACPPAEAGAKVFRDFVYGLVEWKELRGARWVSVRVAADTYGVLADTYSYPLWDAINRALTAFGIREVQSRDVVDIVNGLLDKSASVERLLMIHDLLVDQVVCEPRDFHAPRPTIFAETLERLLVLMCLACQLEQAAQRNQILIGRELGPNADHIQITGRVVDCEFTDNSHKLNVPADVHGDFRKASDMRELYMKADPLAVWSDANCEEGYRRAVHIHAFQRRPREESPDFDGDCEAWSFGSRFLETAAALGFLREEAKIGALLRTCADTILRENMRDIHWLLTFQ